MGIATAYSGSSYATKRAEQEVESSFNPEMTFSSGFTGGHDLSTTEGRSAWFASGLSGLTLSYLWRDETQEELYVQRNAVEAGVALLDNKLKAFDNLGKHRNFTNEEVKTIRKIVSRKAEIEEDLAYTFEFNNGDKDAPLGPDKKSFNQKWGMDEGEVKLMEVISAASTNPKYMAGVLFGELIKDLPIGVLGALGLSSKAYKGSRVAQALNKLNNIKPKLLQGLAKAGVGSGIGAVAGGAYEASYEYLNEGKITQGAVEGGTEFGAAFGLLAGLGALKKGEVDKIVPKGKDKKTYTDDDFELIDELASDEKEVDEVIKIMHSLFKEPTKDSPRFTVNLFDDLVSKQNYILEHGKKAAEELNPDGTYKWDYDVVDPKDLPKEVIKNINDKTKLPFGRTHVRGTTEKLNSWITLDSKIFNRENGERLSKALKQAISDRKKGKFPVGDEKNWRRYEFIESLNANQLKFIQNPDVFPFFIAAHELAHVHQRKFRKETLNRLLNRKIEESPNWKEVSDISEEQLNLYLINDDKWKEGLNEVQIRNLERYIDKDSHSLAMDRIDKKYVDYLNDARDKSALAAQKTLHEEKLKEDKDYLGESEKQRENIEADVTPTTTYAGRLVGLAEKYPKSAIAAGVTAGYAYEDTLDTALVGAGLAYGGPKAYRALAKSTLSTDIKRLKATVLSRIELASSMGEQLNYRAQALANRVVETFDTPERAAEFLEAVEKNKRFKGFELEQLRLDYRALLDRLHLEATAVGMFLKKPGKVPDYGKDGGISGVVQYIRNYVPHVIYRKDGKSLTTEELEKVMAVLVKNNANNRFTNTRQLNKTLKELKDDRYEVEQNPAKLLNAYTQALTRSIYSRRLIDELKDLDFDVSKDRKLPALISKKNFEALKEELTDTEKAAYSSFEHPSLEGYVSHNNIKRYIDDHFEVLRTGGIKDVAESVLSLNNGLKKVFVFGSLFHAQALILSAAYSLGISGAIKLVVGKGKVKGYDMKSLTLNSPEYEELALASMRGGDVVGHTKFESLVNPGRKELGSFLEKKFGKTHLLTKTFEKIDHFTWDYMHDRAKVLAYHIQKDKHKANKLDELTSRRESSKFVNDAFGSQNYARWATKLAEYDLRHPDTLRGKIASKAAHLLSPNQRRWLNLGLFAPDWTVSNIMIIGKFMMGTPKASKEVAIRVFTGKWTGDVEREYVRAWQAYANYATNAGMINSAMWYTLTEMFTDEPTDVESFMEFWETGRMNMGRGEVMVISKQLKEPFEWVRHPMNTLMNKSSIVPKTMMEAILNKRWFTVKKGLPVGPRLVDEDGTTHLGEWILGKGVPIVVKPFWQKDLDWDERIQRVATGFIGFPQYNVPKK